MNHIEGKPRNQYMMLPPVMDEWIPKDHKVRVIDYFVERINVKELGIEESNEETGRPSYAPKVMLKLLLYGYSEGERSSRKLEVLTYENIAYRWLLQDLHPDYRTIARFRSKNIGIMNELLKETIELFKEGGIEFKGVVFSDGSKVRANASDEATIDEKNIEELERIAKKIIKEAEEKDEEEDKVQGCENKNFVKEEVLEKLKEKIEKYKEVMRGKGKRYNATDPDARFMKQGRGGIRTSYNAQISVSEEGVIIEGDVVNEERDNKQLKERISGVEGNTGKRVEKAVADSGYYEIKELKGLMEEGYEVVVPSPKEVGKERGKKKRYDLEDFEYKEGEDLYICPNGKEIRYRGEREEKGKGYKIYRGSRRDCKGCKLRGKCIGVKEGGGRGKEIWVLKDMGFHRRHKEIMEKNKELKKKRGTIVEGVIGIIKDVLNFRKFLLRGLKNVRGEWRLVLVAGNLLKFYRLLKIGTINHPAFKGS